MNYQKLQRIAEAHEVQIDNHSGYKRTPPHYYNSLRHSMLAYFSTFHSLNAYYDFYAMGLSGELSNQIKTQNVDEDNTVLSIVSMERFLELFLKDLLRRIDKKLVYQSGNNKFKKIETLVNRIENKQFKPRKFKNKPLTIPFREARNRYYGLVDIVKNGEVEGVILPKFKRQLNRYAFLDSESVKDSFRLLNWYRDRILHNGNRIPSMWILDYLMTQKWLPIVTEIIYKEKKKIGKADFYFETPTGINLLKKINEVKFEFKEIKEPESQHEIFEKLIYIGHLKELGRASISMNYFLRNNRAGYEYNYKDPKARGRRFALAEKAHPDFLRLDECICCGCNSMVVYRLEIDDIFNIGMQKVIEWVKCYTCDYHIRMNAGDPYFFQLYDKVIFEGSS